MGDMDLLNGNHTEMVFSSAANTNHHDENEPSPRRKRRGGTIIHLLRQFCQTSSMRSVPRIVRAPTNTQRIIWVFALLVGIGMTSYQLYKLLGMYLSYRTSINMIHVKNMAPFPDVTVCNLNPLWIATSSRLNVTWTYEDYLKRLQEFFASGNHIGADNSYLFDSLYTYEGYLQYFSEEDLNQVQDHLIWDCLWEYGEASAPESCWGDVQRHVSPYYGPCSTFHINKPVNPQGQPSRLIMMLFVNDFEQGEIKDFFLSSYYTFSSGARLLVHPRGTFPLMDEGVNLPPGHETTIRVHATKRQVMGKPYGSCVDVNHLQTQYAGKEKYAYTDRVCNKFCIQDYIINSCGCIDPYTPFPKSYRGIEYDFCGLLDFDNAVSVNKTLKHLECLAFLDMEGICECTQACTQHQYSLDVFQVPWPHVNYHMAFYYKYIEQSNFADKFSVYKDIDAKLKDDKLAGFEMLRNTDLIHRNFLEISILLDAEQTTMMEDYPVLSLESLFGNMGGILNLWVGITFVTAVEIMDLLYVCLSNKKDRNLLKSSRTDGQSVMVRRTRSKS